MTHLINIYSQKLRLKHLNFKSDTIGAFASGLCMIHCIATPFFFIVSACSSSCCSETPFWWQWLDYAFLIISFFAIVQTNKSNNSHWVKIGLWISWAVLFFLIINIKLEWFQLNENLKFIPAFSLVFFHVYNMRYLQCEKDCC
tara:strand:+ start:2281 stop:2709 length:429 start_codon:yes stop_codon:yes gene_type:complete